ncbi:MAG TPA: hypothetical protein VJ835_06835, partial [Fimbriimonadaceae bacterium]|nr:hypothetical protein [Fimbriimonadaceae bacterium]
YIRLAAKLKELTQADHLALYTVAEFTDQFVVRATTQDAPSQFQDVQLAVDLNLAPGQIKHRCEQAIASIESTGTQARFANVILIESGRVVGIIALAHSLANSLVEVQARAEEVAPYVASMIQEELRMEIERRRLRETELLYDIASIASGSESVANLASRVARELFASLPADQVSVHWLDSGTPINVASVGANMRMLDAIIEHAWQNEEDWELHLFDARADARIDASAALKNRIGSGAVVPLVGAEGPIGLLVAATHTRGAIDSPQLESLRIAAIELSRAILRLEGTSAKHQGLMTPTEFARAVGKDRGAFVFFEPIRRDHLVEVFGRTAVEHCLQKLARQIRQKLPDGGCICRRDQGDFLVFLPGTSMDRAAKWSDETCGGAALIPVRSVDGTASIPLALRSKVAEFDRQEHGVFDAVSA